MNSPTKIVLTTANARYVHCAFGLRRLEAALLAEGYTPETREFTIQQSAFEIAESLIGMAPDVIGFGVYIWNVELLRRVIGLIRSVSPQMVMVVGGPEMAGDRGDSELSGTADFVIKGEGERALVDLLKHLESGSVPKERVITALPPALENLPSPYDLYTSEDIQNRIVYVESSRGCPCKCAFCLSAVEGKVRYFPLDGFFGSMNTLLEKGVRLFKFTDRTFNMDESRAVAILDFFLKRAPSGTQIHLEIMPDRLGNAVRERMAAFPPGALHLEVGVQSVSEEVQHRIKRHQHIGRTMETIDFLRRQTGAVLHADLIIGLPGDTVESLVDGFDALVRAGVHEIQVGLLKRLKGTPLAGDAGSGLVFDSYPPYEVLQTPAIPFEEIQQLKRFARYFDLYHNSRNFPESLNLLWELGPSPFRVFKDFAAGIWAEGGRTHAIPLVRLAEYLFDYLSRVNSRTRADIAGAIERDFRRLPGRLDKLDFLR